MRARIAGIHRGVSAVTEQHIDVEAFCIEIEAAAGRLADMARLTPVITSRTLDELTGAEIFLKCENFQRVGAFKFRGACNALCKLDDAQRRRGVVTYSSGNHAQALACAGGLLGSPVTVVMPVNAPAVKREATAGYGAEIIAYDPNRESREKIGRKLASERGLTLIPPYDHPDVIAGQGTTALELLQQVPVLDSILVPTGGGGLLSGTALITSARAPTCKVIGVEPEVADDATRSFRTGQLQTVHNPPTIADGVRTPCLGEWTFPIVRDYVADMVTVSETAIREAVRFLFQRTKLVVEPSGALGVAALLSGACDGGGRIGVILSGGNVDERVFADLLAGS
ncbi:MAG: threo-3-hydroxy-L-aspartate ammonia-lyase [Gammaproteobacteria bacterium]|nr:threo-3-hydroxy-L-aspartate ammonia-lyase [Gammaproteobacteria bacterium]NNF60162.1 threo-3-hydroxy-L-aspartate ammonia-lyase [Gammaproteobacteria bacterium]NNM21575.1 threo-3-hydroxy-L-aspartate ammonia-lyase [Gammaproteobacteria bacterium]